MARLIPSITVLCLVLTGCQSAPTTQTAADRNATTQPSVQKQSTLTETPTPQAQPVAYVNGQPLAWTDLHTAMVEAAGGQVLVETVLERGVERRLEDEHLKLTPDLIAREQHIFAEALNHDPDQAQRLLNEMRIRRGLGDERYKQLLERNAGLRLLIQDQVKVQDASVHEAFDYRYGPRYQARIIVVGTLPAAGDVVHRARAGESFIDMAINLSTDISRAQGGLMPPISPADPTYPVAIRNTLTTLQPDQVSDPIALERGFAILKLVRKIEGQSVKYDDVKDALTRIVRQQVEEMLMSELARTIITEADVVVLDPTLERSWSQQKKHTP